MTFKMNIFESINEETKDSRVDGLSKQQLKALLYKNTKPITHNKMYRDETWHGVDLIWKEFKELGLNYTLEKAEYRFDRDGFNKNPTRKEWSFSITWSNNKNKPQTMYGTIVASGAGSVTNPLEKYDLIFLVN